MFKGTYRHRIDGKGRLPVPAAFRRALVERGEKALVLTALDDCLAAYAPAEWRHLEEQLGALPAFARQTRVLMRLLASRAADCELDVQGRILVPPALRASIGAEREVVVVGVLNRFEIWQPSAWDRFLQESEQWLREAALDVPWPPAPTSQRRPAAALPQGKPSR